MSTSTQTALSVDELDLESCAREPIHIPGSIQPYGALLVLDENLTLLQAAVAPSMPLPAPSEMLGRALPTILSQARPELFQNLRERTTADSPVVVGGVTLRGGDGERHYHAIAHRRGPLLILELEQVASSEAGTFEDLYPLVQSFFKELQSAATTEALGKIIVRQVRELTGLDRALLYRFDQDWNGTVIAEDRNDALPSYLDLRFPASDIPAQARELYRLNPLRLIPDANYRPVPIEPTVNPMTGAPVDLSFAVLRSVSPVHLEYMRNMGTPASMSISLLRDGNLWGLLSCHNRSPKRVPFHVRTACVLLGQVLSMQLSIRERAAAAEQRSSLRAIQAQLLAHMAAEETFLDGLTKHSGDLLRLVEADGAAIVTDRDCALMGVTPALREVEKLADWLDEQHTQCYRTDRLSTELPQAESFAQQASGLLAISLSQLHRSYLIWFRREVVQTVKWGGDPRKPTDAAADRLHPRQSFETWKESVRLRALPWTDAQVEAASELRTAIVGIVLRKAEELAAISDRLRSINRELEAFSYSVSHDLRAPFRHIVGYAQLLEKNEGHYLTPRAKRYISTIVESAHSAGQLVDDLLSFSQMGRSSLHPVSLDMSELFLDARRKLERDTAGRRIEWRIDKLPKVKADPMMLQLVAQNLLDNAIKFSAGRDPAVIEIGHRAEPQADVFFVRDNGAGFDMDYVHKLFGVFQRLHKAEEFQGSGIGLANVKRIIERHGGKVWAEGALDKGATFYFSFPAGAGHGGA